MLAVKKKKTMEPIGQRADAAAPLSFSDQNTPCDYRNRFVAAPTVILSPNSAPSFFTEWLTLTLALCLEAGMSGRNPAGCVLKNTSAKAPVCFGVQF